MAPEQAKGKTVDKRADIWSFGVVLFEMLTGRRLFRGEDVSDTLAEVLKKDVDWQALPIATPPAVLRVLHRCLERDPRQRLHDIADARMEIEDALAVPRAAAAVPTIAAAPRRERWLWIAALGAVAAASAAIGWSTRPATSPGPELRLQIVTPPTRFPMSLAVSPDGRTVAFLVTSDDGTQIWTRPLADTARNLPGADLASAGSALWWSPDGRSLLFGDGALLKEIPSAGGMSHLLPERVGGFGWSRNIDGTVLLAPANGAAILRLRSAGGQPDAVTRVVAPQVGHRFPFFLPDGRHFLFLATGPAAVQGVYVGTLDSNDAHLLVLGDTLAQFLPPDWVLFGRQDALLAQRVNTSTWEASGEPQFIADNVLQQRNVFGSLALAVSAAGTVAYRERVAPRRRLLWLDRSGREIGHVGEIDTVEVTGGPRLSPDGRTIALARRVNGNTDLWTIDNTEHGALQRLTSDPAIDVGPVWSPDGGRIAFYSSRRGGGFYGLYQTTLGHAGAESALLESPDNTIVSDWSRDNRFILYSVQGRQQVARDLWALPVGGQGPPIQVTSGPYDEPVGQFSADGRWVAYQSNLAGAGADIYVRPFPGPGREWRISNGGGANARWRQDGREIYYLGPDNRVMAVSVTLPATASGVVEHGTPTPLFALKAGSTFDSAPDGQKFLVDAVLEEVTTPPITVILNWRGK
jgi:Tol biopolymer transport system component